MPTQHEIHEVTLDRYAFGGETIGRLPDGRAVFVPFAIPGELVRVELIEEKRGFARARLLEVLEPSPLRISPRCAHFEECGGCHYQHLDYATQIEAKSAILREQLGRIGKLEAPAIRSNSPSAREFDYRNQVQFHLTPEGALGYHRIHSQEVFAASECHLPEPPINSVWKRLEFEAGAPIDRVGLRTGVDQDVQVILESSSIELPEISVEDLTVSIVHLSPAGALVLAGSAAIEIEVLERRFQVSAGSFFQANTDVAAMMVRCVVKMLEESEALGFGKTALEAYCGVGLFSAFLAPRIGKLIGIEAASTAVDDFVINLDEFDNVEIYEAPAEHALPELMVKPDFVLVDPPRTGLERATLDGLLRLAAPLFVYVSCDPATLGRDARRLSEAGYLLRELHFFDQFPQTYPIESISLWERQLKD